MISLPISTAPANRLMEGKEDNTVITARAIWFLVHGVGEHGRFTAFPHVVLPRYAAGPATKPP